MGHKIVEQKEYVITKPAQKYKLGRPEIEEPLFEAIRLGATYQMAAAAAGIDHRTLFAWRRLGEITETQDPEGNYAEYRAFRKRFDEAEWQGARFMLEVVHANAEAGSLAAATWWLERRFPEDYGKKTQVNTKSQHVTRVEVVYTHDKGGPSASIDGPDDTQRLIAEARGDFIDVDSTVSADADEDDDE